LIAQVSTNEYQMLSSHNGFPQRGKLTDAKMMRISVC